MVRITKCPICSKINKIKHKHYNNFVCCSTKFPISQYQLNIMPQNNLEELEITEKYLEIEEGDINFKEEENRERAEEVIEEKPNPDDYDFKCGECNELFNEEGNRNFFGGIKCPDCGLVNYDF